MKTIERRNLRELVQKSEGRFFTVHFVKKNGENRTLTGRIVVHKDSKGKGLSYQPSDYGLILVWDSKACDYRMVNVRTIKGLTIDKQSYVVLD